MTVKYLNEEQKRFRKLLNVVSLPFLIVIKRLCILWIVFFDHTCKAKRLVPDPLNFSQLVQVHLTQVHQHIVLFDLPIERKAVRYLEECFEIVWHLEGSIIFLPFGYRNLSNAWEHYFTLELFTDFALHLPCLSLNSTSFIPIWFSRKLMTESEILSKISRTPCLIIVMLNISMKTQ